MEIVIEFRCDECGFDNTKLDNEALCVLITTAADAFVQPLDHDAALLRQRPQRDVWSVLEYAVHQREVIRFYAGRIEAVATVDNPQLTEYGFGEAADRDGYNHEDPTRVAEQIRTETRHVAQRLKALAPDDWSRTGKSSTPGAPPRDIRNLASRLAHEFQHHGRDIDKGLAAVRP